MLMVGWKPRSASISPILELYLGDMGEDKLVIVVAIVGVGIAVVVVAAGVVVEIYSVVKLSFVVTLLLAMEYKFPSLLRGWAYAFHQDKASSVRVPVANVTLFSSAHLLRENTDSVRVLVGLVFLLRLLALALLQLELLEPQ
ncbi:hypothetical protein Tco_0860072 [Tanacetum coccineum]|uniref:Uncharacterized protein n=1 Tax=Tanacetum coccineum TaxID=301880 RepID=A0ABQ5BDV7_9ASTR